jgi:hypothetical protein
MYTSNPYNTFLPLKTLEWISPLQNGHTLVKLTTEDMLAHQEWSFDTTTGNSQVYWYILVQPGRS